jgi:hypothetical protein
MGEHPECGGAETTQTDGVLCEGISERLPRLPAPALGKGSLGDRARPTTRDVDRALGLPDFVHFYLARGADAVTKLPILRAQLGPSDRSAVPHGLVEIATADLDDAECLVCNWNLAVSRPGVPGMCRGGNWTRGTDPDRIADVWRAFRKSSPSVDLARGLWKPGVLVPVLAGAEISHNLRFLRRAPSGLPELLLRPPVPMHRVRRVLAFSERDRSLLSETPLAGLVPIEFRSFTGYSDGQGLVSEDIYGAIERALLEEGADPCTVDFDGIRPKPVPLPNSPR